MENAASSIDLMTDEIGEMLAASAQHKVPIVTCTIENVLGPEDIAEYLQASGNLDTAQKSDQKDVSVLRARHHSVARLLATGLPEGIVAELTGFDPAYLSTLKNNPSMIELTNLYRAPGNAAAKLIEEKLRMVGDAALSRILEEMPSANMQELIAAAKLGSDRSGNGPQSKVAHEHVHVLDPSKVAALADSARRVSQARIVDVNAVRKQLPAPDAD